MLTIIALTGTFLEARAMAARTICIRPPQQGTSIIMTVMVFTLAVSIMTVSFSMYVSVPWSSFGQAIASALPLRKLLWNDPSEKATQSAASSRSAPLYEGELGLTRCICTGQWVSCEGITAVEASNTGAGAMTLSLLPGQLPPLWV